MKLVKTKPACAPVLLARSTAQEVKQDRKDLAEQQQRSKAALDQLVSETAEEEQEQVRCGVSSHHLLALWGGPGGVPSHIPWLTGAMESPWHLGLLVASVPSQR